MVFDNYSNGNGFCSGAHIINATRMLSNVLCVIFLCPGCHLGVCGCDEQTLQRKQEMTRSRTFRSAAAIQRIVRGYVARKKVRHDAD